MCITRQIGWLSIMGTAKVLLAYLCGQSSPTGRAHAPDKSPAFMGGAQASMQLSLLWLQMTCQLLQGVLEHEELPHRTAVCGSSVKDFITTDWEHSAGCCREKSPAVVTELLTRFWSQYLTQKLDRKIKKSRIMFFFLISYDNSWEKNFSEHSKFTQAVLNLNFSTKKPFVWNLLTMFCLNDVSAGFYWPKATAILTQHHVACHFRSANS